MSDRSQRVPVDREKPKITSRHLCDVASQYLACLEQRVKANPREVLEAWSCVIGHPGASMSKALKFEKSVLLVSVNNSSLLSLLSNPSEKRRLLGLLRSRVPGAEIIDIEFCFG